MLTSVRRSTERLHCSESVKITTTASIITLRQDHESVKLRLSEIHQKMLKMFALVFAKFAPNNASVSVSSSVTSTNSALVISPILNSELVLTSARYRLVKKNLNF